MSKSILLFLAFVGIFLIIVYLNRDHEWQGFYYPGGVLAASIQSPIFKDKESCINWGEKMMKSRPQDKDIEPQELYECGRDCKPMIESDPNSVKVCEQNFDGGDWRRGDYDE